MTNQSLYEIHDDLVAKLVHHLDNTKSTQRFGLLAEFKFAAFDILKDLAERYKLTEEEIEMLIDH